MRGNSDQNVHDQSAPYWAFLLVVLCLIGLSTTWVDLGWFWTGYVLDIVGPAWNYILFRGLYTKKIDHAWFRFFSPGRTLIVFIVGCCSIEVLQYFEVYESTFDPWDFLAYVAILIPIFIVDFALEGRIYNKRV